MISVRQRRDYRVPSVAALIRLAEDGRPIAGRRRGRTSRSRTVADAVLELLQSGDGSLGMLDVPELDPLDGVVMVAEVDQALDPQALEVEPAPDPDAPFRLGRGPIVAGSRAACTNGRSDEPGGLISAQ